MENLPNIIIYRLVGFHQFHFMCAESNIHYFPRFFLAPMFLLMPAVCAGIEGWLQENPDSAWRLGLEKMINPLQEEEGMCSAWVDNLLNAGGVGGKISRIWEDFLWQKELKTNSFFIILFLLKFCHFCLNIGLKIGFKKKFSFGLSSYVKVLSNCPDVRSLAKAWFISSDSL